jgi:hypothetical protein
MPLLIEQRGLVYDATRAPAEERVACFTSLCRLRSGAILCGFQLGPQKNSPEATIGLCRSDDEGRTWRRIPVGWNLQFGGVPGSLSSGEMVEAEPGRLLMFATWFDRSDRARPLFDPVTEGILRSKQLLAESNDEGASWSDWREVATPGLTGCAATGPVWQMADGALVYPFESFKEFDDPSPKQHGAWILVSRDGGRSFSQPLLVARDPQQLVYYWDQRLAPADAEGELTALFWTHDLNEKRDLTVHLRRFALDDAELKLQPIQATSMPGQIAAPLWLADGRLLAFVVDRNPPCTMKLWSSRDGGRTWPAAECLTVYEHEERAALSQGAEDIDFAQYWEDMGKWSFGHPALRALGEQRVLATFYAGAPDCMSVHFARVRCDD